MQSLRAAGAQEIVALDGKPLRRALHADQSIKYVVTAWAEHNGLALGQWKGADKSNEITAVPLNCCGFSNWPGVSSRWRRWAVRKKSPRRSRKPMRTTCWHSKAIRRRSLKKSKPSWTQR